MPNPLTGIVALFVVLRRFTVRTLLKIRIRCCERT